MDIEANIREFLSGVNKTGRIEPSDRYASYDYCFNYFQSFRESGQPEALAAAEHLHASCLQLGFYLASWGMLRGSSFLLNQSVKVYEPVVMALARVAPALWDIDTDCYTLANIGLLLNCGEMIAEAFGPANNPSDILVTKVMLGVFGNVPAFDNNFKKGFRAFGVSKFGRRALEDIARFYDKHKAIIDKDEYRVTTLDFVTGQHTHRRYTRAKVVDMIFFTEGAKVDSLL